MTTEPLPDSWIEVLDEDELDDDTMTAAEVGGITVLLAKVAGTVHAYVDACPHAGTSLTEDGDLDDEVIVCGGHGWEFDVATGRCLDPDDARLTLVPVRVTGSGRIAVAPPEEG
jgi:nitrite reductase/ring-hydroxylating ferredoxin subunit